jgi:hypothetical protein
VLHIESVAVVVCVSNVYSMCDVTITLQTGAMRLFGHTKNCNIKCGWLYSIAYRTPHLPLMDLGRLCNELVSIPVAFKSFVKMISVLKHVLIVRVVFVT